MLRNGICSIFLIIFSFSLKANESGCSQPIQQTGLNSFLENFSKVKNKMLDDVTENFPAYCQWNRMDRFSKGFSDDIKKQYQDLKSQNNIDEAAKLLAGQTKNKNDDLWSLSMSGHPTIKNLANNKSFIVSNCQNLSQCSPATKDDLLTAFSKPFSNNSLFIPEYKSLKNRKVSTPVQRLGACSLFNLTSVNSCTNNLINIENDMETQAFNADQLAPRPFLYKEPPPMMSMGMGSTDMPFTSSMVTAAPVIKNILTDASATEGLRRAVIKMLKRQNASVAKESNAFDDIKESFEEAGISSAEAENKAWNTMAALASAGPNFAKRWSKEGLGARMDLNNIKDNPNAYALQVIAETIPKLDTIKMSKLDTSLYSLPKGVHFPCDIGKSYHFWMTAFLARKLVQQGADAKSASSSAYIADLGYQINREVFAGSKMNMKKVDPFGATENGLRMDLVLAAAGAKYGANTAQNKTFEVDLKSKYVAALKKSPESWTTLSVISKLLPDVASKSVSYIDRISPIFIFDSIK